MKGRVQYTQNSVAFPGITRAARVMDDIIVSLAAKGGGAWSEFMFEWIDLGSQESPYVRVAVFSVDGLQAMLDPRVMPVIRWLKGKNPTPEQVIRHLEKHGAKPSVYHCRGLLERNPGHDERLRLLDLQAQARAWEVAT